MTLETHPAERAPPLTRAEETILGNLTEAMASVGDVLACAVVVAGESAPTHVTGSAQAAAAFPGLTAVRATLADGAGGLADMPAGGPLAAAAFIAVEPVALYGEGRPRAVVLAGNRADERDRAAGLLRALALETASEMAMAVQAPYLAASLDEAACGITIADPNLPDTPLVYVNDSFMRMTGYDRAELLGRNCRFLQGQRRDQPQIATLHNALRQGLDCTVTLTNLRKSGEVFANRLKLRAVRAPDGSLAYYVGIQLDVTAEQTALESLRHQERRYDSLIRASASYISHLDAQGRIQNIDAGWLALAGQAAEQVREAGRLAALSPDEAAAYRGAWQRAVAAGDAVEMAYHLPADGADPYWLVDRLAPVRDADGEIAEWIATTQDITAQKRAERELREVVESAPIGMLVVAPDGTIERANERATELFGYALAELIGLGVEALVPEAVRSRHAQLRQGYMDAPERRRMGAGRELEAQRKDGTVFPVEVGLNAYGQGAGQRVVASVTDITERRAAEREVERAAFEDRLTGLMSRAGFTRALARRLAADDLHPASLVVAFDLRALRDINNVRGYSGGDAVLREVARRLCAELGESGLAARLGEDEFGVLVPLIDRRGPQSWRRRLAGIFRAPFDIDGVPFYVEAAFGYTRLTHNPPPDSEELLRRAELALHRTQQERTRSWSQYTTRLAHAAGRHSRLVQALRHGLEHDQFSLYYQPKLNLATGRIVGAEALLRWHHPERGLVPPGEFIPVAEASQLIGAIGDVALEQACRDLAAWRAAGRAIVPISVNVSAVQFKLGGFPQKVQSALARHGLAACHLVLEVTESAFRSSDGELQADLDRLRELGVALSLDDFGTGYSALLQLRDEPFDEIKIDKGFVLGLDGDAYGRAIVTAVLGIAEAIGARVIAEGVETAAVAATLQRLGCGTGQGFYYDRPLPEADWRGRLSGAAAG